MPACHHEEVSNHGLAGSLQPWASYHHHHHHHHHLHLLLPYHYHLHHYHYHSSFVIASLLLSFFPFFFIFYSLYRSTDHYNNPIIRVFSSFMKTNAFLVVFEAGVAYKYSGKTWPDYTKTDRFPERKWNGRNDTIYLPYATIPSGKIQCQQNYH